MSGPLSARGQAALSLAAAGHAILPICWPTPNGCSCGNPKCRDVAKHPFSRLAPHGLKDATSDPKIIEDWWAKYPNANLAVHLGRSGLWVLDADRPRPPGKPMDGLVRLAELEEAHGAIPPVPTSITGGGGQQLFFVAQKGSDYEEHPLPSIDTKSGEGYVVVPPSLHKSGQEYTWVQDAGLLEIDPQPAPDWLEMLVQKQPKQTAAAKKENNGGSKIPEGKRHRILVSMAGKMRKMGFNTNAIGDALRRVAREQCNPPQDDIDVDKIIRDASKWDPGVLVIESMEEGALSLPIDIPTLRGKALEVTDYLVSQVVPTSSVIMFAGKPKVGKSTLLYGMIAAMEQGNKFLGKKTKTTKTLVVTEEPVKFIQQKVDAFGIANAMFYTREDLLKYHNVPWADLIYQVAEHARSLDCGFVVIDPLATWARLPKDAEKDAGAATAVMHPLMEIVGPDLSVMVAHHTGKGDRGEGDEVRGSGAFVGAVDVLGVIKRFAPEDLSNPKRKIYLIGRPSDLMEEVVVELRCGSYEIVGLVGDVIKDEKREAVLDVIKRAPPEGLSVTQISELSDIKRISVSASIQRLLDKGMIRQVGGQKNNRHNPPTYRANELTHEQSTLPLGNPDNPQVT